MKNPIFNTAQMFAIITIIVICFILINLFGVPVN